MTVLQNVIQAPIHVLGVIKAAAVEKEEAMLHRVGFFDKRDQFPANLSAGQHPKRNQRHEECPQNVFVLCSRSFLNRRAAKQHKLPLNRASLTSQSFRRHRLLARRPHINRSANEDVLAIHCEVPETSTSRSDAIVFVLNIGQCSLIQ